MQVLCKSTEDAADVCCPVCGKGFRLFWEGQSKVDRALGLQEIDKALRAQHKSDAGPTAHPERGFLVPDWDGPIAFSGAAILGHAPSWAL